MLMDFMKYLKSMRGNQARPTPFLNTNPFVPIEKGSGGGFSGGTFIYGRPDHTDRAIDAKYSALNDPNLSEEERRRLMMVLGLGGN